MRRLAITVILLLAAPTTATVLAAHSACYVLCPIPPPSVVIACASTCPDEAQYDNGSHGDASDTCAGGSSRMLPRAGASYGLVVRGFDSHDYYGYAVAAADVGRTITVAVSSLVDGIYAAEWPIGVWAWLPDCTGTTGTRATGAAAVGTTCTYVAGNCVNAPAGIRPDTVTFVPAAAGTYVIQISAGTPLGFTCDPICARTVGTGGYRTQTGVS